MSVLINASTSTGLVQSADTSGEIELQSNGTTALKVNTNEGIQILNCLGVGNATPSTSGAGITFPASQSASTDANTLDDYEEGSWTPAIADAASGGNSNTSNSTGRYTKIGNQVTIYGRIDPISTSGLTAGNQVWIRGFPFTTSSSGVELIAGSAYTIQMTFTGTAPQPYVLSNATGFRLFAQVSAGNGAQLNVSAINSGNAWIYFTVTYQV